MTIQNLEISTAHFTNNERTEIEVLLFSEESTEDHVVLIPFNIEAKAGDADYEWLISKIDVELIHENTYNKIREERESFEAMVMGIAEADGLSMNSLKQDEVFDIVIDTMTKELDEESLFRFKLKIFDNKDVKDSNDRGIKAEIRKAKSIPEVIAAFLKI